MHTSVHEGTHAYTYTLEYICIYACVHIHAYKHVLACTEKHMYLYAHCTPMHAHAFCMSSGCHGLQILISYPLPTYDSGRNGWGWIMWWWASHWSHPIPTPTRTGLNLLKNKLVCLHSSSSLPSPGTQISTVRIRWMTDLFKINLHLFIRLIFN